MSAETLFQIHLILGYLAWLLCFGVYALPKLRSVDPVEAHGAIASLHSFRFFGLVFILPGVVGPNLPAGFATFAAYWDLATGLLAMAALLTVRIRPLFWMFVARFQSRGSGRPHSRLLPRDPGGPSCARGAVGLYLCDPDHLRARADDHPHHSVLSITASSAQGRGDGARRILDRIRGGEVLNVFGDRVHKRAHKLTDPAFVADLLGSSTFKGRTPLERPDRLTRRLQPQHADGVVYVTNRVSFAGRK
jgi:hypothetical protein